MARAFWDFFISLINLGYMKSFFLFFFCGVGGRVANIHLHLVAVAQICLLLVFLYYYNCVVSSFVQTTQKHVY